MSIPNVHDQVVLGMQEMTARFSQAGVTLDLPPQSSLTLGTRYIEITPGKMLTIEIKFDERFGNPLRYFQGGFLAAAFDEACGPLTYMAAQKPAVTIEMSTSFIRPFTAKDEWIRVRAEVVSQNQTLLVLKAEARNKDDKLIATSSCHALILNDAQLNRARTAR